MRQTVSSNENSLFVTAGLSRNAKICTAPTEVGIGVELDIGSVYSGVRRSVLSNFDENVSDSNEKSLLETDGIGTVINRRM